MRFANSLMLRLAIRVRFADAGLAKEYAEKAVKHPAGLIDSKELAAQMGKGAGPADEESAESDQRRIQ